MRQREAFELIQSWGLSKSWAELFSQLPVHRAMPTLMPKATQVAEHLERVADAATAIRCKPIEALLWLYVDDLEASHRVSQDLHDATGAYLHAMMHRREGDFWNSNQWYAAAGEHPVIAAIQVTHPAFTPVEFVDQVRQVSPYDSPELLNLQRLEWLEMMLYCKKFA